MTRFQPGDRIKVTGLIDDPDPIPIGTTGTIVEHVNERTLYEQLWVDWDAPRSLALLPRDYRCVEVIERKETA